MKKLSKKQKLIGGIAIILVAVILAIVITTNIISNNNQSNQIASQEEYLATTANAGSSLVASYIKKGITIGGITGTLETLDTSDATAKPEDIALGKTAYVKGEKITGTRAEPISNEDLQISADNVYYADIDDDGTVDGVIFADLAVGGSGEYGTSGYGTYTIPKADNLKSYYIKSENYIDDSFKKSGKIIAPMKGTSGNDRFYVMALKDIDSSSHYWYYNAYGKLDNTISYSENDFGKGRENTEYVNNKWNDSSLPWGAHNSNDMWGLIQDEIANGWFVPSKSEWAAFGAAFEITSSNYSSTFGLGSRYWSSSQSNAYGAYRANFLTGGIGDSNVSDDRCVRLAATF